MVMSNYNTRENGIKKVRATNRHDSTLATGKYLMEEVVLSLGLDGWTQFWPVDKKHIQLGWEKKKISINESTKFHHASYNHWYFAPLRVLFKFSMQLIETLLDANQKFQP